MRIPDHPTQIRRMLESRRKQFAATTPLLSATLSEVSRRCGKPACRCHHGGPLHTTHQLTFKQDGKTHTLHVPQDLLPEVQTWSQEYQRTKQLLREMTQLALALVKGHAAQRTRKKGRA
jgi:hypothetical protein